jgi:proline iminopeptidase
LGGAQNIFPDRFQIYRDAIPKEEQGNLVAAYYKRLTSGPQEERVKFAKIWSVWECATSKLKVDEKMIAKAESVCDLIKRRINGP